MYDCLNAATCKGYTPAPDKSDWQRPDPISGLTPRYKPNTPPPEGAVLLTLQHNEDADIYWTPKGNGIYVKPGCPWCEITIRNSQHAARTLGLPLAGEDMKDGEEMWTQMRLHDATHTSPFDGVEILRYESHAQIFRNVGLDNLRRWVGDNVRGWICRRIEAKPGPCDLGEWRDYKLTFCPDCCQSVYAWNPNPPEADRLADRPNSGCWKPEWKLSLHPPLANALLTAYRRAVAKGLATIPVGWEWLKDEMSSVYPCDSHIWLGRGAHDWPISRSANGLCETCRVTRARAAMLGLCEPEAAKPGPGPAPFEVGQWVQYHVAVGKGGRAIRVSRIEFDNGSWRWTNHADGPCYLHCADYRVVAKDV